MVPIQEVLLEMPERPEPPPQRKGVAEEPAPAPKLKPIDREQGVLRQVVVEELVGPDHKVRAIWDLTERLNLSGFFKQVRSFQGRAGSPAWNPQLLLSIWLYAYSEQISSAREIARLMEYEPGLMWLSGLGEVNYHTLADFRSRHAKEIKELLAQLLGVLDQQGLVDLALVAHDGTRIRAQAGADSFRRRATLEERVAEARRAIEALDQAAKESDCGRSRREAARQRAARERLARMEQAAAQLATLEQHSRQKESRVSLSEPEARLMKHGDAAIAPSYNLQLSTEPHGIIVGAELTQTASDSAELAPAVDRIAQNLGRAPTAVVADGGFTNRAAIEAMQQRGVDFYGSLASEEARQNGAMKAAGIAPAFAPTNFVHDIANRQLRCPAGCTLDYIGQSRKRGNLYWQYQSRKSDCAACPHRGQCCPPGKRSRLVSLRMSQPPSITAFRAKMETPEARQIYRRRGPLAEFANCWIKEKLGLRKFRLRGLAKARIEALWAVLTHNVQQYLRLHRDQPATA